MINFKYIIVFALLLSSTAVSLSNEDILRRLGDKDSRGQNEISITDRLDLGIQLGINNNSFSQNMSWDPPIPESVYNVARSGDGTSYSLAFLLNYKYTPKIKFQFRLAYNTVNFENSYNGIMDCLKEYVRYDLPVESHYEIKGSYICPAVSIQYKIYEQFFLSGGIVILIPISEFEQFRRNEILSDGCKFPNGTKLTTSNTKNEVNPHFDLEIGIGYEAKLSNSLTLVPQVCYFIPLSNYDDGIEFIDETRLKRFEISKVSTSNLSLAQLQFSISFLLHLN